MHQCIFTSQYRALVIMYSLHFMFSQFLCLYAHVENYVKVHFSYVACIFFLLILTFAGSFVAIVTVTTETIITPNLILAWGSGRASMRVSGTLVNVWKAICISIKIILVTSKVTLLNVEGGNNKMATELSIRQNMIVSH